MDKLSTDTTERESQRGALETALNDLEQQRDALAAQLKHAVAQWNHFEVASFKDREQLRLLEAAQLKHEKQYNVLREEIETILRSRSWKVTRPLRWSARALRTLILQIREIKGRARRMAKTLVHRLRPALDLPVLALAVVHDPDGRARV